MQGAPSLSPCHAEYTGAINDSSGFVALAGVSVGLVYILHESPAEASNTSPSVGSQEGEDSDEEGVDGSHFFWRYDGTQPAAVTATLIHRAAGDGSGGDFYIDVETIDINERDLSRGHWLPHAAHRAGCYSLWMVSRPRTMSWQWRV